MAPDFSQFNDGELEAIAAAGNDMSKLPDAILEKLAGSSSGEAAPQSTPQSTPQPSLPMDARPMDQLAGILPDPALFTPVGLAGAVLGVPELYKSPPPGELPPVIGKMPLILPGLGDVPGVSLGDATNFIKEALNPSYRDIVKGGASAAGMLLGAPLTPALGPTGMMLGGITGEMFGDVAAHDIDRLLGADVPTYSLEQAEQALPGAVVNNVLGGLMGVPDSATILKAKLPQLKASMAVGRREAALTDLARLFSPTTDEAFGATADKAFASRGLRSPDNIRRWIDDLTTKYGFKFDSPESLSAQVAEKLGYVDDAGKPVFTPNSLPVVIDTLSQKLDEVGGKMSLDEVVDVNPIDGSQITFVQKLRKVVEDKATSLFPLKGKEAENIRTIGSDRINSFIDSLIPEQVKVRAKELEKEISALTKKSTLYDGSTLPRSLDDIARLDKLNSEYYALKAQMDNPQIGFADLHRARMQLDDLAKEAHQAKDQSGIKDISSLYEDLSNTMREIEENRAMSIDPAMGEAFVAAKDQLSLLKSLFPGVKRLSKAALNETEQSAWDKLGGRFYARLVNGVPQLVGTEPLFKLKSGEKLADVMKASQAALDSGGLNKGTPSYNLNAVMAEMYQAGVLGARQMAVQKITRDVGSYIQSSDSLKSLENRLTLRTLADLGAIQPEQVDVGVDLNQLEAQAPGLLERAQMQISPTMQLLRDAVEFGDQDDVGLALTQVIKQFPGEFPKGKYGIKGEVTVGGKSKLYDPMDRARYSDMVRKRNDLSWEDKARIVSNLNYDYSLTD